MPRARDKFDAQSLDVVDRVVERVDLELATVARARVDLADAERAPDDAANLLVQALGNAQGVVRSPAPVR